MKDKRNHIHRFPWLFVMFFFAGIAIHAQDSLKVQSPSSTALDSTRIQQPSSPGTPSVSSRSSDTSSPRMQDLAFNTEAAKLANDLVNQTGVSTDKAVKITEILKDYRNDIASARADYYEKHPKEAENQEATGSSSAKVDMKNILGDNVEQYYTGVPSDLMSDYRDADKKADKKIKDVFDNDVQTSRYEEIKGQWWNKVKAQVFPSLSEKTQNQNEVK